MIKNVVAIYPGRFQPFGKHHAAAFKWLQQHFDGGNCYIATSNVIDIPKSPFSFKEKADIIRHYGFEDRLVQVKNPYKAEEILQNYRPEDTAVIFMVGAKDMKEDPRFKIGKKKDGSDSYFQEYEKNKSNLQSYDKHGYLVVAPHVSVNVTGYGEMSGTSMRKALGNVNTARSQKINLFKSIFGWYDENLANMIFDKLESVNESKLSIAEVMKKKNLKMETKTQMSAAKLFSKEWWSESLELTEAVSIEDIKSKFSKFIKAIKQESQETKEAFKLLILAATGKKSLTDFEQKQIGDQLKDVLKTIGLTAITVMPGGFIAAILIKVLKAEKYITPSSFMEGYMSPEQQKAHDEKMIKLKDFLNTNTGKPFEYDFDEFPKTVYGVKMPTQESVKCEICNEQKQQLTGSHMLCKHGITLKEYKSKFPNSKCIPNSVSKKMSENNAMKDPTNVQKIKKTKLERYGSETYNNPKYGDDNPSKRDDVRKLISKKVTESYNKDPKLKINRSEIGTRYGFGNKKSFKKKMIDNGYWMSENSKTEFNLYRDSVRLITETNNQCYFKEILNAHLRSRTMHLDHKYSIFEGFIHDIDPHIIGHYKNLEIINHSINESKNIKSSISLSKLVEDILNSKNTLDMGYQLLMCGGAGGHMQHPFNIDWVKTGKDLVTVFQQSIEYLQKGPASVKIDGVNASIRLITLDGQKVFVMDRGSNKPLDVKGITKAELTDRFGEGHGMIKVGGTVLDIFNEAIPQIMPALKKLGLWDNPNIMFNLEYVAGSTNVLSYNKNFLAVHGLLEIGQITPTKRATKEKPYNKASMQDLLNNLIPSASKRGYEVLGSIPTTLKSTPDLTGALNKKYTVNYGNKKETKTLSQWLATAVIPDGDIKTVDGKRIAALSKDVLIKISEGTPLPEYIADPKDYKAAVDGFVIYMATMKLGDAILEKLNSPLGPVSEHEGIVIRDRKIYNKPFKITGSFIIKGMSSSFKK
jgi:hypothetical protein